jgi:hypothetical protein
MGVYVIEAKVQGIRSVGRQRWFQDIKEALKITSDNVGVIARDMDSFRRAVMIRRDQDMQTNEKLINLVLLVITHCNDEFSIIGYNSLLQ